MNAFLDVILLFLSTTSIVGMIALVIFKNDPFTVTLEVLFTFIAILIATHLICFLRRKSHTKDFPRIIDYFYLTTAALGLIGAALDVDILQARGEMASTLHELEDDVKTMNNMLIRPGRHRPIRCAIKASLSLNDGFLHRAGRGSMAVRKASSGIIQGAAQADSATAS